MTLRPRATSARTRREALATGALSAGAWLAGCPEQRVRRDRTTPVLLLHGMFGDHTSMQPLADALRADGFSTVSAPDIAPVDGSAAVPALASQVEQRALALSRATGAARIDVVGYSLGAMLARYWIQRGQGRARVRRFVSLAGPHHGVLGGLLSQRELARELRPASAFLMDLDRDADPWGRVEVASFFSPMDAVIVPTETAILKRSRVIHPFAAPTHHHMATDPWVLRAVTGVLSSAPMTLPPDIPTVPELERVVREAMARRRHHG